MQYGCKWLSYDLKKNCNSYHCIFIPYSLLIFTVTDLEMLHQKDLVKKKTYDIIGVEWEMTKTSRNVT